MSRSTETLLTLFSSTGATILETVYGFNVESEYDPHLVTAKKALHAMSMVASGTHLVDSLPIRKYPSTTSIDINLTCDVVRYFPSWFPGAGFQRNVTSWKRSVNDMIEPPFSAAKASLKVSSITFVNFSPTDIGKHMDADRHRNFSFYHNVST